MSGMKISGTKNKRD